MLYLVFILVILVIFSNVSIIIVDFTFLIIFIVIHKELFSKVIDSVTTVSVVDSATLTYNANLLIVKDIKSNVSLWLCLRDIWNCFQKTYSINNLIVYSTLSWW